MPTTRVATPGRFTRSCSPIIGCDLGIPAKLGSHPARAAAARPCHRLAVPRRRCAAPSGEGAEMRKGTRSVGVLDHLCFIHAFSGCWILCPDGWQ
eukprot:scaffold99585_cov17-Tisochrysis_lutea.AAC.2